MSGVNRGSTQASKQPAPTNSDTGKSARSNAVSNDRRQSDTCRGADAIGPDPGVIGVVDSPLMGRQRGEPPSGSYRTPIYFSIFPCFTIWNAACPMGVDFQKAVLTMWTLVAYFGFVVFLVGAVLIASYLLGPRHSEPATGDPYEGGIVSEGSARVRVSVKYYLIAMFFVVFDLEAVFLFAWAGAVRELGWAGYCEVLGFVAVLFATLIYLWKVGALDWTRSPRRPR
jgi:NADH-quinone oxidoreductase subunit A